jgi:hypothetical protein
LHGEVTGKPGREVNIPDRTMVEMCNRPRGWGADFTIQPFTI